MSNQTDEKAALRENVQRMIKNEGWWIATDINHPGSEIPICSIGGKLRAIQLDQELDPERFLPSARFTGPFRGDSKVCGADGTN